MAKQNINSKKGFTIIEVVLVLAIAGLIFLMVFVALPALQRAPICQLQARLILAKAAPSQKIARIVRLVLLFVII